MKPYDIEVKKLEKDTVLVVSIKQNREFKIRMWLAMRLFALGAKIAECGIEFDDEDGTVQWE